MGYIENNLVHGEAVVFRTKLHWWVIAANLLNAIILGAIFAFLLFALQISSPSSSSSSNAASLSASCLMCGFPLVLLSIALGLLNYSSSEFGLTNRRIMIKTGIIRRHTIELNLGKVESFQVRETIWGRIVGYKTIILTGSGGTHQNFKYVAQARQFQKKVTELSTETHSDYKYTPTPPAKQNTSIFDDIDLPAEDTQNLLREATQQIKLGNRPKAQQIVQQLVRSDPQNADVWYLVGYLSSSPEKKRQAFERAIQINPNHQKARQGLSSLNQ